MGIFELVVEILSALLIIYVFFVYVFPAFPHT